MNRPDQYSELWAASICLVGGWGLDASATEQGVASPDVGVGVVTDDDGDFSSSFKAKGLGIKSAPLATGESFRGVILLSRPEVQEAAKLGREKDFLSP